MSKRPTDEQRIRARVLYITGTCETDAEIAERVGVVRTTVVRWKSKENWAADKALYTERRASDLQTAVHDTVEQMKARHLKMFTRLQERGFQYLESVPVQDVSDVLALIETGVAGERLTRGIDDLEGATGPGVWLSAEVIERAVRALNEGRAHSNGAASPQS